jgi:uncharacterized iron-regulated membrane protein
MPKPSSGWSIAGVNINMVKAIVALVLSAVGVLFITGVYAMWTVNNWARDYLSPTRRGGRDEATVGKG